MLLNSKTVVGVMMGVIASTGSYSFGAEIALVPVRATGSPIIDLGILGQPKITVQPGRHIFLEVRLSDWDVDLNQNPQLKSWQVEIDAGGYDSSGFDQLVPVNDQSCSSDNGCNVAFVESGSECTGLSCPAGFQDTTRTDWVFNNLSFFFGVDTSTPNFRYGASIDSGNFATDDGSPKYGGTLVLFVPSNARGTFTVGFTANTKQNFMRAGDNSDIQITNISPVEITVNTDAPCCLPDRACRRIPPPNCVIAGGTVVDDCLGDQNANGTDDACEFVGCCHSDLTCTSETLTSCAAASGTPVCDCVGDNNSNVLDDACEVGCVVSNPPLPENSGFGSCITDGDCPGVSTCLNSACYVPKNRYISFVPNDPDRCVAYQVTLSAHRTCSLSGESCITSADCDGGETCDSTTCEGSTWWVGPAVQNLPDFPDDFIARLVTEPVYRNWTEPVVQVSDFQIVPVAQYEIRAIRQGCDINAAPDFSTPLVLPTSPKPTNGQWGDIVGSAFGDPPDGVVDFDDFLSIIKVSNNEPSTVPLTWADLNPVVTDGRVDAGDLFDAIKAFQNVDYPGPLPCAAPNSNSSLDSLAKINGEVAQVEILPTLTCDILSDEIGRVPEKDFIVEIYIDNVADLAIYQSAIALIPEDTLGHCEFSGKNCSVDKQDCINGRCADVGGECTVADNQCNEGVDCLKERCLGHLTIDCEVGPDIRILHCLNDTNIICSGASGCSDGICVPNEKYIFQGNRTTFNTSSNCSQEWIAMHLVEAESPDLDFGTTEVGEREHLTRFIVNISPTTPACTQVEIVIESNTNEDPPPFRSYLAVNGAIPPDKSEPDFIPDTPNAVGCVVTIFPDCNKNGESDFFDIEQNVSADCNGNHVPDECEIDFLSMVIDPKTKKLRDFYCISGGLESENGFEQCEPPCDNCVDDRIPCDTDCNNNGIPDVCDIDENADPKGPNKYFCGPGCVGCPDTCDDDCNGNLLPDLCEIPVTSLGGLCVTGDCDPDCNKDSIPDSCNLVDCTDESECGDCDGDGIMNRCDTFPSEMDCDGNGVCNICEIDCDGLGGECVALSDNCQTANDPPAQQDCQGNGIPDNCEIVESENPPFFCREDCFGCIETCDEDCNGNSVPDLCDISFAEGEDCVNGPLDCKSCDGNSNQIPDDCDCIVLPGCVCADPDITDPCNNLFPAGPGNHDNVPVKAEFVIRWIDGTLPAVQSIEDLSGTISVSRTAPHVHADVDDIDNPCVFPPDFPSDTLNREVHMTMLSLDVSNGNTQSAKLCTTGDCNLLVSRGEAQGKCIDFPADSTFNLFVDLNTGSGTLHNRTPLVLRGEINNFEWPTAGSQVPTWEMVHEQGYPAVPLFDTNGIQLAYIINAKIGESVENFSPVFQCDAASLELIGFCDGGERDNLSCRLDMVDECPDGNCVGSFTGVSNVVTFTVDKLTKALAAGDTNHVGSDDGLAEKTITVYRSSGANIDTAPDGTNVRIESLVGLGALAANDISGISFGRDGTSPPDGLNSDLNVRPVLYFSVDTAPTGTDCANDLNTEENLNRAADLYIATVPTTVDDDKIFGGTGTFAPACVGGGRKNCLLLDQSGLGLAAPTLANATASANITSVEISSTLNVGPDLVYLTFNGSSFTAAEKRSIFVYDGEGDFNVTNLRTKIYATDVQLGLGGDDRIDAIAVYDHEPLGTIEGGDIVLYSLTIDSPTSKNRAPGDIIFLSKLDGNPPTEYLKATDIGLLDTVEIDAIDVGVTAFNDCNKNDLEDRCETQGLFTPDNNKNELPDICEPINNRYLRLPISVMLETGIIRSDIDQAIRIKMVALNSPDPPDFSGFEGKFRWVGVPGIFTEGASAVNEFDASFTQCGSQQDRPQIPFINWSALEQLVITGADIVPSSTYHIQVVGSDCSDLNDEGCYSDPPLIISTSRWGDVVAPFQPPSIATQPTIADVLAVVDKWLGALNPVKALAQIQPNVPNPNLNVGIADVLRVVDAWLGSAYSFFGPCICPPDIECVECGICSGSSKPEITCLTNDDCPGTRTCGAPNPDICVVGATCSSDETGFGNWYCRDLCKRCDLTP